MSAVALRRDLVLLVADKSIAQAITGLLQRPQALGMHRIDYEMRVHQQRDLGCRVDADWLSETGHWPTETAKPPDPKRAMKAAMQARRRPKSA